MSDTSSPKKQRKPSRSARNGATRLAASQLVYEHFLSQTALTKILQDHQLNRANQPLDEMEEWEAPLIEPDYNMMADIFKVVDQERASIDALFTSLVKNKDKTPELLIKAIFTCAAAELYKAEARQIDPPIIINDYLNVTRAFFDDGEVKFVNGLLNSAKESVTL